MPGYLGNFPNALVSVKLLLGFKLSQLDMLVQVSLTFSQVGWSFFVGLMCTFCRSDGHFQQEGVTAIIKNVKNTNFPNAWVYWELSQIPRHSGNFPDIWHLRNFQNLKNIPPSNTYENLGNFPHAWISGKFPKCLGIWEISQMPGYLGNFPNAWVSGKFPKCLCICEISQIP